MDRTRNFCFNGARLVTTQTGNPLVMGESRTVRHSDWSSIGPRRQTRFARIGRSGGTPWTATTQYGVQAFPHLHSGVRSPLRSPHAIGTVVSSGAPHSPHGATNGCSPNRSAHRAGSAPNIERNCPCIKCTLPSQRAPRPRLGSRRGAEQRRPSLVASPSTDAGRAFDWRQHLRRSRQNSTNSRMQTRP